jgi:hypothetical protein
MSSDVHVLKSGCAGGGGVSKRILGSNRRGWAGCHGGRGNRQQKSLIELS